MKKIKMTRKRNEWRECDATKRVPEIQLTFRRSSSICA